MSCDILFICWIVAWIYFSEFYSKYGQAVSGLEASSCPPALSFRSVCFMEFSWIASMESQSRERASSETAY